MPGRSSVDLKKPKPKTEAQRIRQNMASTYSSDFGLKLQGMAEDINKMDLNPSNGVLKGYFKKAHKVPYNSASNYKLPSNGENMNHLPRGKH